MVAVSEVLSWGLFAELDHVAAVIGALGERVLHGHLPAQAADDLHIHVHARTAQFALPRLEPHRALVVADDHEPCPSRLNLDGRVKELRQTKPLEDDVRRRSRGFFPDAEEVIAHHGPSEEGRRYATDEEPTDKIVRPTLLPPPDPESESAHPLAASVLECGEFVFDRGDACRLGRPRRIVVFLLKATGG